MKVLVMRGMGMWAKDWRRPLPVGSRPIRRALIRSCIMPTMMPSSIRTFLWVGVPSSSMESEPRRPAIEPSSTTVTPGAATRWPILPEKTEEPFLWKSPSNPWPTASCSSTPGQPAPSTTSISPAGQSMASRLTRAMRMASSIWPCQRSGAIQVSNPARPPAPWDALSRRPSFSTVTETFSRTSGRTSLRREPSARRISMARRSPAMEAETWTTRGSLDRA